jgi:hypothetical protein
MRNWLRDLGWKGGAGTEIGSLRGLGSVGGKLLSVGKDLVTAPLTPEGLATSAAIGGYENVQNLRGVTPNTLRKAWGISPIPAGESPSFMGELGHSSATAGLRALSGLEQMSPTSLFYKTHGERAADMAEDELGKPMQAYGSEDEMKFAAAYNKMRKTDPAGAERLMQQYRATHAPAATGGPNQQGAAQKPETEDEYIQRTVYGAGKGGPGGPGGQGGPRSPGLPSAVPTMSNNVPTFKDVYSQIEAVVGPNKAMEEYQKYVQGVQEQMKANTENARRMAVSKAGFAMAAAAGRPGQAGSGLMKFLNSAAAGGESIADELPKIQQQQAAMQQKIAEDYFRMADATRKEKTALATDAWHELNADRREQGRLAAEENRARMTAYVQANQNFRAEMLERERMARDEFRYKAQNDPRSQQNQLRFITDNIRNEVANIQHLETVLSQTFDKDRAAELQARIKLANINLNQWQNQAARKQGLNSLMPTGGIMDPQEYLASQGR